MELTKQEREKIYDKDYCNYPALNTYLLGGYRISVLSKTDADQFDYERSNAVYVFDKSGVPYKIADITVTNEPSKNIQDTINNVKDAQNLLNKALEAMFYVDYNEQKLIKSKDYKTVLDAFQVALETDSLKYFNIKKLASAKSIARSNENLEKLRKNNRKFAQLKIDDVPNNLLTSEIDTPELTA